MPFKISELSDFKNVRTLAPGAALILADGDEKTGFEAAPFMVIGIIGSTPAQPDDRGRFAQQAATTIPGVRDARITMSEPIRIDGQPGYETRIDATSGKDNTAGHRGAMAAVRQRRPRCASSAARRATNGRKRFHASAPCATEFSRASRPLRRRLRGPSENVSPFAQTLLYASSVGGLACSAAFSLREMQHVGSKADSWQAWA